MLMQFIQRFSTIASTGRNPLLSRKKREQRRGESKKVFTLIQEKQELQTGRGVPPQPSVGHPDQRLVNMHTYICYPIGPL